MKKNKTLGFTVLVLTLAAFVAFCPLFASCKKDKPEPPPPTFNDQAQQAVDDTFDFDFFPFDLVNVIEIYDDPQFTGFKFTCDKIDQFKLSLSRMLLQNGFEQGLGFFIFNKIFDDHILTIQILLEEDGYIFDYLTQPREKSEVEKFEEEVEKLLGFHLDFPDDISISELEITEISLGCSLSGYTLEDLISILQPQMKDGASLDGGVCFLTKDDGSSVILTMFPGEDDVVFSISVLA